MQRAEFVLIRARQRLFRRVRLGKHGLWFVIDEGVQLGIQALDAVEVGARYFDWRNFFATDLSGDFACGKLRDRRHEVRKSASARITEKIVYPYLGTRRLAVVSKYD